MKYCVECGHEIQDDAKFCPACGKQQYGNQSIKDHLSNFLNLFRVIKSSYSDSDEKVEDDSEYVPAMPITYVGIGLIALSVFFPCVAIIFLVRVSFALIDVSGSTSLFILILCGVSIYAARKGKHAPLTMVSNGFLMFCALLVYRYLDALNQLQNSMLGSISAKAASNMINIEMGSFLFLIGTLVMGFASGHGSISQWTKQSIQPINGIPAVVGSVVIALILAYLISQIHISPNGHMFR